MPRYEEDWRRRFTEWDLDEEDDQPRPAVVKPDPAPAEETHEPRPIQVVLDESGAVRDVVIPENWRETTSPRELGPALLDAANRALGNVVAAQVEAFDLGSAPEQPVVARKDAPDAGGDPTSPIAEALVNEALDLFSRYDRDLKAYAAQVRRAATATSRGAGGNGRIVVTMTGGRITGVEADPRWAVTARYTEVRVEALSAFRAAGRGSAATRSIALPASITRLQELASDPEALSQQLGLSR